MILAVTGGRKYWFTEKEFRCLDEIHHKHTIELLLQGGAQGADFCAKQWAIENNIQEKQFDAEWTKFGEKAGGLRNQKMLNYLKSWESWDEQIALLAFPGFIGTRDCVNRARAMDITIFHYHKIL